MARTNESELPCDGSSLAGHSGGPGPKLRTLRFVRTTPTAGSSLAPQSDMAALRQSGSSRGSMIWNQPETRDVEIGESDVEVLRFRPVRMLR